MGVHALPERVRLEMRRMIITTQLTYRLFLIWSLVFHLYSTPLYLNLRDLREKSEFVIQLSVIGERTCSSYLLLCDIP